MYVGRPELCAAMAVGDVMYLADGAVRLRVRAIRAGDLEIDAEVEVGGAVASRQGLNVPGPLEQIASVPAEDLKHLAAGEKIGVDLVALSFVRSPQDIQLVREHTRLPLIAKIEKPQAVDCAEEIIRAADCVMVARGDLGIELPIERVPIVQKNLLSLAGKLARPSITATQMLDSMVASSRPTRAEVADVANAILDGTDAVMLSQETAIGHYPVESIAMMASIAEATEPSAPYQRWNENRVHRDARDPSYTMAYAACLRRARARARRARHPDAVGALGAPGLRAPPDGADLRALAGPRDRAPLRAHVGRAGGVDPPPRGHRGAHQRRRAARRRARLAAARPARRDHRGPAERRARAARRCCRSSSCNVAACSPRRPR